MKKLTLAFAFVATVALFSGSAQAQEATPAANTSAPAAQTRNDTPEYQNFAGKMSAYKNNLKKLRAMKSEYQSASAERKDEIAKSFETLVNETAAQQKDLIPQAIAAYKSVDGQNDELRAFLCAMLQWSVGARENYEIGYQVAKAVFEYPLPKTEDGSEDQLYGWAAFAAFCTMNLDDAEKWRDIAKEKGVLEKIDPQHKMQIPEYLEYVLPMYKPFWAEEQTLREKEAATNPLVVLHTTAGDIKFELFLTEAPNAVNNFLSLIDKKFYDDVPFHRVLPFFMAQGGDPTGTGTGGPGYCIPCECYQDNARKHFRGSLSMAHAGRNTGGSQFFITFVPTYFLNGKHTVFGRVVEGMDVLSDITRIDPEKGSEEAPTKIITAEILRGKPGEFKKLNER